MGEGGSREHAQDIHNLGGASLPDFDRQSVVP